ncbi:MAG: hypothetical protein FJX35_11510 [Alphaproteobacteria bacterium]|nr:hypothetical protein [Alphaproteobacteria bacterium]
MTLIGALSNAASALRTTHSALGALSNNVSNVNTPGYARKAPLLAARSFGPGTGGGVDIAAVTRLADRYLQAEADRSTAALAYAQTFGKFAGSIDAILGRPADGQDLGSLLAKLRDALLAATSVPSDASRKRDVVTAADRFARAVRDLSARMAGVRGEAQQEIERAVAGANAAAQRVAELNKTIATGFGLGQDVGLLQDQRARDVETLVDLVGARAIDCPDGSVELLIGAGGILVDAVAHELGVSAEGVPDAAVLLDDQDITAKLATGRIGALLAVRDGLTVDTLDYLDALSLALIGRLNAAYADAASAVGRTAIDGSAAFASGDTFAFTGTIRFMTVDTAGRVVSTYDCTGGAAETLAAFSSRFRLDNAEARVVDGRLHLETTDPNRRLALAWAVVEPGTVATAADTDKSLVNFLGLNDFLIGTNASNLSVRDYLAAQPELLATAPASQAAIEVGIGAQAFAPGDPTTLKHLVAVLEAPVDLTIARNGQSAARRASFVGHAANIVGDLAMSIGDAADKANQAAALNDVLRSRLSGVSGVNIDQEMAELTQYQNAYNAAARLLSVVNDMLHELEQAVVR